MIVSLTKGSYSGSICYSADDRCYRSKPTGAEIGGIRNRLSGESAHTETSVYQLAQLIESGITIQGAQLRSKQNSHENTDTRFLRQQIFAVDLDNVYRDKSTGEKHKLVNAVETPERVLEISHGAGLTPCIIAESFSSTDALRKYHVLFAADKPVTDISQARQIILNLQDVFGAADEACKDPARILFGTSQDKTVYVCNEVNPAEALLAAHSEELLSWDSVIGDSPSEPAQRVRNGAEADPFRLLQMIDPNALSYEEWCRVTASYKLYEGADRALWEAWNNQYSKVKPKNDLRSYEGLTGKDISKGTLKYFARLQSPADYDSYIKELRPTGINKPPPSACKEQTLEKDYPEPEFSEQERKSYITTKCIKRNEELINRLSALNPSLYSYCDRGSSELFADMFGHEVKYNTTAREWYYYTGSVWKLDSGGMVVHSKAKAFFDALMIYAVSIEDEQAQKAFREYYSKFGSKNKRDTLIKDAADCCYISSEELDSDPNLFNCLNGTLELDTLTFRAHDSRDHITKLSNVVYDKNARSDEWEKFLGEVIPHDKEKIRYLQKAVGYSLSGSCCLETCFILYGATTRNGKSTLVGTITHMLGGSDGYARSAPPEILAMKKNKDSRNASEDIARLAGCRFLNVSEPPQSMAFDAALLKTLTGRDTITARFLYQGSFEYMPQFTLFINTNYLPKVLDETLFTSHRINVIEFNRHFSPQEQDTSLKGRLKTEENISGLFNWCIEGLKLYRAEGLDPPFSVAAATRQYAQQSDKIGNFIDECLEESADSSCTAKDAYEAYRKWCSDCGYCSEGKQKFMELLRGKGLISDRGTVNGKRCFNILNGYIITYAAAENA